MPLALPAHSRLHPEADDYVFHDIQRRPLRQPPAGIDTVIRAFLASSPAWADRLMRLRDQLVRPLGLKTAPPWAEHLPEPPYRIGQVLGIFRILGLSAEEVVMGEDDRHLDFRVSLLVDGKYLYVSTLVRPHNWLGRGYLTLVLPFHHLIVVAMSRRMVRQLDEPAAKQP